MGDSTKTVPVEIITESLANVLEVKLGANLLESLLFHRISIAHSCGGHGICTTCRINCRSGLDQLSPRTELELERAEERQFAAYERLACQCMVLGAVSIEIP